MAFAGIQRSFQFMFALLKQYVEFKIVYKLEVEKKKSIMFIKYHIHLKLVLIITLLLSLLYLLYHLHQFHSP